MFARKKGNTLQVPPGCGSYGSESEKLQSKSKERLLIHSARRSVEGARKPFRPWGARQLLKDRRQLAEVALAAEQTAVMRESMRAEFEAALTEPIDQVPIDLVLRQRQIPGRSKIVALLEIRHLLHPAHSERTFDVVGQHDAAFHSVGPESDVPAVVSFRACRLICIHWRQ